MVLCVRKSEEFVFGFLKPLKGVDEKISFVHY